MPEIPICVIRLIFLHFF
uniref:Uncharacterized protein n=1 Tax=Rhizophora mucronata TaxID=61149 RepID=A0A2P2NW98_RHIMU